MVNGGDRRKDRRMDGRKDGLLEIYPCVLQDIGPLGPLPKKESRKKIVIFRKYIFKRLGFNVQETTITRQFFWCHSRLQS